MSMNIQLRLGAFTAEIRERRNRDGEFVTNAVAVEDDGVRRLRENLSAEMCDHESDCIGRQCAEFSALAGAAALAMICDIGLVDDGAKSIGEGFGVAGGEAGGVDRVADDELERTRTHHVGVDG